MRNLTCLILAATVCSCSGSEPSPAPEESTPIKELAYEIFPFVVQLDDAALAKLTASEPDGTLRFSSVPPALASAKRGTILLGGSSPKAREGLLRIVRDVQQGADGLVLHTVGAPPQLAFKRLHVVAAAKIPSWTDPGTDWTYPPLDPLVAGSGKGKEPFDFYLFDGDGNTSTTGDQVHVHGELGGGIDYDVGIDTDWGAIDALKKVEGCAEEVLTFGLSGDCELPEIKAHLYISPNAEASVRFEGTAFNGYEKEYTLASVAPQPTLIPVGPLTFTVVVDVISRVEGKASSQFAVGAKAGVKVTTGLEYSSLGGVSFKTPVPEATFAPDGTDVTLSGFAKVGVGPRLSFRLYGIAGPYAGLYGTAALDADQSRTPCFDLHAGADVDVGFILTLPGIGTLIDEGKTFNIVDQSVATGTCKQPPAANKNPPGGGPDPEHLLNPTITPWAKMYDSPVQWFPHQTEEFGWLDLSRSIDGRWVLGGSGLDALTKVDDQGAVVWSKKYLDPRTEPPYGPEPAPYLLRRVLATQDAAMLVVADPYALLKLGQAGGVYWAERFEPPGEILETGPNGLKQEQRTFLSAVEDGKGGFFVAGSYEASDADPSSLWLQRIRADGSVEWSRRYDDGAFLYPTQIVRLSDSVFVAGLEWNKTTNGRRMLLAKLGLDGTVQWAKAIGGCDGFGYPGMQPFELRVLSNGDVLVAGAIDLARRSFVMEVAPDGAVHWASSPWGDDTLTDLAIHAVRELPTTGFVAAGRYAYHFEQQRVFLAGLDASGKTQWIKIYGQPSTEQGIPAEQGFPALALTDEGGALMAAYTSAPVPSQDSNLWMLLAPAKDGAIVFDPVLAHVVEYPVATVTCPTTAAAVTLVSKEFVVKPVKFDPIVEQVKLAVTKQTP
ncbi:MAG: hypothetical protein HY898_04250 [Deltaproteobacteria bacterium]|nr:hypothetical protein [Deltaproteobacteria bacterium]